MALATKYRIFFSDFDGAEYRADIQFEGYLGAVIELVGKTGNACSIQFGDASDKFQVVNGSGCTLSFYNDGYDLSDLFAIGIYDLPVRIERYRLGAWFLIWVDM